MALDLPLSVKIEEWRRKALDGTITIEEVRASVDAIRAGRLAAASRPTKSKTTRAAVDLDAMENELDNL